LDPLASGVLAVLVGPATRLADHVQAWRKTYAATFRLGQSSDTEDIEGQIVEQAHAPIPTLGELETAAGAMIGTIRQRPPAYSALKVKGRRAYQLARAGQSVELDDRPITIYQLTITAYRYPDLSLRIVCGSGTYVRSVGRDLAAAVGTTAVMGALVREAIGQLTLDTAVELSTLASGRVLDHLRPASEAVSDLPQVSLSPDACRRVWSGLPVPCAGFSQPLIAALAPDGQLAAILAQTNDGLFRPVKNFPPPHTQSPTEPSS
jgi:tRNA pseudouridine55 synthase